jgi:TRAP-type mannitol/chloroaromatic compound transport system substrate-binding protein
MTTKWKRRQTLSAGAAVAAAGTAAASSFPKPAIAQGRIEWRMVTTWPKLFPGQGTGAVRFAESVAAATDGRLQIKVFAAGELVPAFESFDAVVSGAADLMHATPYYWQGKSKALNFFSTVPFGLTTAELQAWMRYGGGWELWDELYDQFGLKGFYGGSTGVQMGGWFNKEINGPADFQGLKMRIPGLGGEVLKKLGVTVVNLPAGEIFAALQSGAVDATEWVGPYNDLALGFFKVAKYYYWPGIHEPGTEIEITVSKSKFAELPKDLQAIFEVCCRAEDLQLTTEFNARNGNALVQLVRQHGVQLRQFPDEVLAAMGNASGEVIAELRESGDDITRRIVESFLKARDELKAWSTIGEYAFMRARGLKYDYA